ncbi:MAG: hypothetical protein JST01_22515 [Cyanobacteria bacterium SZAS TMP-1]|nr:hypothetical protein [Cyanobacteria bacterium SZAS TMP-1]
MAPPPELMTVPALELGLLFKTGGTMPLLPEVPELAGAEEVDGAPELEGIPEPTDPPAPTGAEAPLFTLLEELPLFKPPPVLTGALALEDAELPGFALAELLPGATIPVLPLVVLETGDPIPELLELALFTAAAPELTTEPGTTGALLFKLPEPDVLGLVDAPEGAAGAELGALELELEPALVLELELEPPVFTGAEFELVELLAGLSLLTGAALELPELGRSLVGGAELELLELLELEELLLDWLLSLEERPLDELLPEDEPPPEPSRTPTSIWPAVMPPVLPAPVLTTTT